MNPPPEIARPPRSRPVRYLIAGVGIGSFALAVLGALLPGLPTTVFLIISSYCFAKSCPHLYDRLLAKKTPAPSLPCDAGVRSAVVE